MPQISEDNSEIISTIYWKEEKKEKTKLYCITDG